METLKGRPLWKVMMPFNCQCPAQLSAPGSFLRKRVCRRQSWSPADGECPSLNCRSLRASYMDPLEFRCCWNRWQHQGCETRYSLPGTADLAKSAVSESG